MSHLNLINETHPDHNGAEPDMHTPMLKPTPYDSSTNELAASRDELHSRGSNHYKRSVEIFTHKSASSNNPSEGYDSPAARGEYRRSYTSVTTSSVHPLLMSVSSSSPHPLHHTASAGRLSSESKSSLRDPRLSPVSAASASHTGSPEREQGIERRQVDYMLSRSVDHLERPAPLPKPGALLCCTSELQVNQGEETYRKARPTLVIPAHYMRLPGTHPLSGQALLLQSDVQSELESIQAELSACHQPQGQMPHQWGKGEQGGGSQGAGDDQGGGVEEWTLQTAALSADLSIPNSLSQAGIDVVQMNGEDQLLAEKTLMELRGGKPLPHPRAWFVSLDGRSNAHIRHSYIDLQRAAGCNNSSVGSNDASLDSGVDMSDLTPGRRVRDPGKFQNVVKTEDGARSAQPVVRYPPLVLVEGSHVANGTSSPPSVSSPEEVASTALVEEVEREEDAEETPSPPSLHLPPELPSPPPLPEPVEEMADETAEETETFNDVFRTEETQMHTSSSRPNNLVVPDDGGEDETKKSPWQKREERPLMAFNLK